MEPSEVEDLKAAFGTVVGHIQQGKPAEAELVAKNVLQRYPNEPNILRVLGVALMRQGKVQEAEKPLETSVKMAPELAAGHEQYGTVLGALGKLAEAEQALKTALKLDPHIKTAYSKLARLLAMQGKSAEAQEAWDRMFALNPNWSVLQDAMKLQQEGKLDEARQKVKTILRQEPNNVNALNMMGGIALAQNAANDAEAFLRKAVEVAPDFAIAWSQLGIALKDQNKYAEAVAAVEKAISMDPMNADWYNNLGTIYLLSGDEDKALSVFEKAVEIRPQFAGAWMSLGHVLKTLGKQDEAIAAYRKSAEIRPEMGEIYFSLSNLKTFRFDESDIGHMKAMVASGNVEDESEVNFCFSLAKHYEDRKDYDTAFEYYQKGNEKRRTMVRFDPAEFQLATDAVIKTFSKDFFRERQGWGHADAAPILIVGLPRSGSTLVEQILSSHSHIDGTAELGDLQRIAVSTGANRSDGMKYPLSLIDTPQGVIEDLGKGYIDSTARHRQGAPYFTDKMPNNFSHIGFLHLILPNAKVIDARRHPLDSCFGSYKQLFARGQTFSYDLFDLAEYYKNYVRVMAHWDEVLPGKVLRVQYEDNVADQEAQARRMIDFLGLDWEEQMTRFYESDRAVKTASSEQVRQPIYNKSVNTWKRYESHLQDLIADLEPVLEAMPEHLERPQALQK